MRHIGQGYEITVQLPDRNLSKEEFLKQLLDNFYKLYRELFGRTVAAPVEVITWRLRASGGKGRGPRPHPIDVAGAPQGPSRLLFHDIGPFLAAPAYDHSPLPVN